MTRAEFSRRTKYEAFQRSGGHCEAKGCGAHLTVGKYEYDHIVPAVFGGDASLENCQCICRACHVAKTRGDNREAKKSSRVRDKHIGAVKAKPKIQSRGFAKAHPQHSASRPLSKKAVRIEP